MENTDAAIEPLVSIHETPTREWLAHEKQRQVQKYIELGLPRMLGMTNEAYTASFPELELPDEQLLESFTTPILVETRLSSLNLAELAGLSYRESSNLKDSPYTEYLDPKGDSYNPPQTPYNTWIRYRNSSNGETLLQLRDQLEAAERGATEHDGIVLWMMHRDIFQKLHLQEAPIGIFGIALPGSHHRSMKNTIPVIGAHDYRYPVIFGHPGNRINPNIGYATCLK